MDLKLENYLSRLDRALGPISISERADIITEIKSHVLDAKEKNPDQTIDSILSSLGEPETVANRYLIEKGLKPNKPPKSPIVKWLVIGFLGTFGICCAMVLILVWKFSPIIAIDDQKDRVSLLGGFVSVDGQKGRVQIGGLSVDGSDSEFHGQSSIDPKNHQEIFIKFTNGKVELSPSKDELFHWSCKSSDGQIPQDLVFKDKALILDLSGVISSKCQLFTPEKIKIKLEGNNGKIEVFRPQSEVDVIMNNGKVYVEPDPTKKYRYDNQVLHGKMETFESSTDKEAISIRIRLNNGKIEG